MTDAGKQWLLRIDDCMLVKAGMERAVGVIQVIVRKKGGEAYVIVAKVIDAFLVSGRTDDIKAFFLVNHRQIIFGKTAVGAHLD